MPLNKEFFDTAGLILLLDSHGQPGRPLTHHFLHKWTQQSAIDSEKPRWNGTLVVAFEETPSEILVESNSSTFVGLLDCISDPSGWNEKLSSQPNPNTKETRTLIEVCRKAFELEGLISSIQTLLDNYSERLSSSIAKSTDDSSVDQSSPISPPPLLSINLVIDSLTPFLLRNGCTPTSTLFNRILSLRSSSAFIQRVIVTLHEDVITQISSSSFSSIDLWIEKLSYLASLVIQTAPPPLLLSDLTSSSGENLLASSSSSSPDGQLHILQRRSSGKVIRLTEEYAINRNGILSILPRRSHSKIGIISTSKPSTTIMTDTSSLPLPTAFELETDKQKKDRKGVELPYTLHLKKNENDKKPSGGGGIVYLEPTDEDYESDDPDDDLDI